jgi:two-component system cell cycle response regulator
MIPATKDEKLHGRVQARILLVCDESETAFLSNAFQKAGHFVVGVTGGAAALVQIRRTRPHVIVAGAALRGISSEEFARLMSSATENVPFILIGRGPSSLNQRVAANASGAFDYFHIPDELELLLQRVKQLVALTQTMERLRAEADRDYLTGLANRRRFRTALGQEVERWRRYGQPCSLLIADLDHLKQVNDTFGHSAGDVAIRHVSSLLTELSRDNDTAARLGGEEFALLLAGANNKNALAAAERLREGVAAEALNVIGKVTISLGVASCPSHATTERALYAASDAALYRAKREGRNRCCVAELVESA